MGVFLPDFECNWFPPSVERVHTKVPVARGGVHSAWLVLVLATCSKPPALESGCLALTLCLQEVTCLHNAGSTVQKGFKRYKEKAYS